MLGVVCTRGCYADKYICARHARSDVEHTSILFILNQRPPPSPTSLVASNDHLGNISEEQLHIISHRAAK